MTGGSRQVVSNQDGTHDNLEATVRKHLTTRYEAPIAGHNRQAFEGADRHVQRVGLPLVLDSGCGTGDSSRKLAGLYPDHLVIGVDKSAHRLTREREEVPPENLLLVRADLMDFYRLAARAGWQLARHYILYPNPWPKAAHLQRRWHGSPVFPDILKLGGQLELRTNWKVYAEEFAFASEIANCPSRTEKFIPTDDYFSLFEEKYAESGQNLWHVQAGLDAANI